MPRYQINLETIPVTESENQVAGYENLSLEWIKNFADDITFAAIKNLIASLYSETPDNKGNINLDEVFTVKNEALGSLISPSNLYGFALRNNKEGQPILAFGSNELPIVEEDGEFFVADIDKGVKLTISLSDVYDDALPVVRIRHKKDIFSVYPMTDHTGEVFDTEVTNLETLAAHLKSITGGSYAKLVDFVRMDVPKGRLSKPIVIELGQWETQEHEEYGKSYIFDILNTDELTAYKADTLEAFVPNKVIVRKGFLAFQTMERAEISVNGKKIPSYQEQVLTKCAAGGSLLLVITALANKNPDKKRPQHKLLLLDEKEAMQFKAEINPGVKQLTSAKA